MNSGRIFKRVTRGLINGVISVGDSVAKGVGITLFLAWVFGGDSPLRFLFACAGVTLIALNIVVEVMRSDADKT